MNYLAENSQDNSVLEHNSRLPIGAVASNAIKPDYELTIPDVCEMFNIQRHALEGWIIIGMVRFRMDGDMVYFLLHEITADVKFARMHDSFRTADERNAARDKPHGCSLRPCITHSRGKGTFNG